MDSKIGKTFKLTKKLGSGAFGEIFHGINVSLNKHLISLKIIQKLLLNQNQLVQNIHNYIMKLNYINIFNKI